MFPIDILEPKRANLTDPQSVDRKEHDNSAVSDALLLIALCTNKQPVHILPRGAFGQPCIGEHAGGHNAGRKATRAPAPFLGVPKKDPQYSYVVRDRCAAISIFVTLACNRSIDITNANISEGAVFLRKALEKLPHVPPVTTDSGLRQTPIMG
jgi:hypothetical protein